MKWLYVGLLTLAVTERLGFDLGPNGELVTMAGVVGGMYFSKKWAWTLPLLILALTDGFLGIGRITFFTWTGFLLMPFLARGMNKLIRNKLGAGLVAATVGIVWFYLWTNLGVFITDSWGMYANSYEGLINCYINAIPFLSRQLVSGLISTGLAVLIIESSKRLILMGKRRAVFWIWE